MALKINMPAWLAAGQGLTLYMAAFSAEIFRGGIQSIKAGAMEHLPVPLHVALADHAYIVYCLRRYGA